MDAAREKTSSSASSHLSCKGWLNPTTGHCRLELQDSQSLKYNTRPSISMWSYLEKIVRHADYGPSCYMVAYIYLGRFLKNQPSCPMTLYNVHFLILTSVMVVAKFMDDMFGFWFFFLFFSWSWVGIWSDPVLCIPVLTSGN